MSLSGNEAALSGRRVLVIEDNDENMRLFRAILLLEGAEVLEASAAKIGIDIAGRQVPDIILMDMQMPGMDGLSAARHLRTDANTATIPIIIITASAMDEDRRRALESGCDGYITKPIDPSRFGQQIAAFLSTAPLQKH